MDAVGFHGVGLGIDLDLREGVVEDHVALADLAAALHGDEFAAVFAELARTQGLAFYPFFLEGVAGDPALNLPDGLHPNARGVEEIVRRMLPVVEPFLKGLPAKP